MPAARACGSPVWKLQAEQTQYGMVEEALRILAVKATCGGLTDRAGSSEQHLRYRDFSFTALGSDVHKQIYSCYW
jgi:hypothetical protein